MRISFLKFNSVVKANTTELIYIDKLLILDSKNILWKTMAYMFTMWMPPVYS